jgi:PAS domain S-box-containing protein
MLATCGLADLQALIETIGADVFVVDVLPDGSFLSATHNTRLQRSTGMDIKAAQAKPLAAFMDPAQTALIEQHYRRCVATRQTVEYEIELDLPVGRRWWHTVLAPIEGGQGRIVRLLGTTTDTTERRRRELDLAVTERHYRHIVQDHTELICRYLPDTTITFCNDAYARLRGVSPTDMLGRRLSDLLPPEDWTIVDSALANLTPDQSVNEHELRYLASDRTVRWIWWRNRAFFDQDGNAVEYQSIGSDITDRKNLQEQLSRRDRLFRLITGHATDMIALHRPDRVFRYVSPSCQRLLGYQPGEMNGR